MPSLSPKIKIFGDPQEFRAAYLFAQSAKKLEPSNDSNFNTLPLQVMSRDMLTAFREKRETRLFLKSGCKDRAFFSYMQIFYQKRTIFCRFLPNCAMRKLQTGDKWSTYGITSVPKKLNKNPQNPLECFEATLLSQFADKNSLKVNF